MIMKKQEKTENEISNNEIINKINETEEDEEVEENKKMDMFFNLIKNYQKSKKRRRQDLTQDSGDTPTKRPDGGDNSDIIPAKDLSHTDIDLNLKPSNSTVSTKNQEEEEEEEETKKEISKEHGLDLNLAL
ncbi:unnamed protein product [Cochlearia groenlandica]